MKFSIIVPVYNSEKYLSDCVISVLDQSCQDFELVLVDDGSTDSSGELCEALSQKDSRIKVFHKSNSGQLEARYYGVERANGEFIVFLDSDDKLAPYALEHILATVEQYDCDMVIYDFVRFSKDDEIPLAPQRLNESIVIEDKKQLYITLLFGNTYNSMCRKAIRREFFSGITYEDFSDIRHGEDLLQTLDIVKNSPKTVIIPNVLYYYRTNLESVTKALNTERYILNHIFVRDKVYEQILEEGFYSESDLIQHQLKDIDLFCEALSIIAIQKIKYSDKKRLYNAVKASHYYKSVILKGYAARKALSKKNRFKITLFKNGFLGLFDFLICSNHQLHKRKK